MKVWNGTAFVADFLDLDSVAVANSLTAKSANIQSLATAIAVILKLDVGNLVASDATVDTAVISKLAVDIATVIKLDAGTITTGELSADRIDVNNLAVKIATILKLDVSHLIASDAVIDSAVIAKIAAQIVTSSLFRTSATVGQSTNGNGVIIDSAGMRAYDTSGNQTVDVPSDGSTPLFVGGVQTGGSGQNRISLDYDSSLSQGQLNVIGSNDQTLFQLMGNVDSGGFNNASLILNNSSGQVSDIVMRNRSASKGGTVIAVEADEIQLNSTQLNVVSTNSAGSATVIPLTSVPWTQITPPAGSTASVIGQLFYCVRGGVVYLRGRVRTTGADAVVWSIPTQYMPKTITGGSDNMSFICDANGLARAYVVFSTLQLKVQTAADFTDLSMISWPISG